MKINLPVLMAIIALISLVFIIDSCKKEKDEPNTPIVTMVDTTKPVITLKGSSTMTIVYSSIWSDPGYIAIDNKDGDLTTKVIINGTINNFSAGIFTLTYSVTDAAGNTGTTTRNVTVDAAPFLAGYYSVVDVSNGFTTPYNDNIIASDTLKNRIYVNKFAFYANAVVYFNLNGSSITLPRQEVRCGTQPNDLDHTFEGTGIFTANKRIFITYSDSYIYNGTPYIFNGCTETYTAQ